MRASICYVDLNVIHTGITIIHNVDFGFSIQFFLGLLFVLLAVLTFVIFRKQLITDKQKWISRIIKVLAGFLIILSFSYTNIYKKYSLWDINDNYSKIGSPLTLLRLAYNMNVRPPKGYNKEEIKNTLAKYESSEDISNEQENDNPNIIVIVNESFCDFYNLFKDGYANPIEYFNNLSKSENVISGTVFSSVYGGQTANVEYEFLTQNSLRSLPVGSYVFQQYIKKPVNSSIVTHLKSQGYTTAAIHSWNSDAYSRKKIYKFFNFDSMKFREDINDLEPNFNNDFSSDRSTYRELLRQINNKNENEKLFEYVLTVQNHIAFSNPDPNQPTYNDNLEKNVYMQLIHESEQALKEVIDELEKKDEKYILLFFGDHQPNLDESDSDETKNIEFYEVPFIIWANYDIEEQYDIKTSTVYLQNLLLKTAGVKYSAMNNYMSDLQKEYPIITSHFYVDKDANIFETKEDTSESEAIDEYGKITYYRIFDN